MTLLENAILLAVEAHSGQTRKYSNLPYIIHPLEVMSMLKNIPNVTEIQLAAAVTHDILEDCELQFCTKLQDLSQEVYDLVVQLTNKSHEERFRSLPRVERKKLDRAYLSLASDRAKEIKLIDRICNLRDTPPGSFKKLYIQESRLLLDECLRNVNLALEVEYMKEMLRT